MLGIQHYVLEYVNIEITSKITTEKNHINCCINMLKYVCCIDIIGKVFYSY